MSATAILFLAITFTLETADATQSPCRPCKISVTRALVLNSGEDGPSPSRWSRAIETSRGEFLLTDSYAPGQLLIYNRRGRLIGTIGRRGKGPGEFAGPALYAAFDNDHALHVVDPGLGRLTVFNRVGQVIRTVTVPTTTNGFALLRDGNFVIAGIGLQRQNAGIPLQIISSTGKVIRDLAPDPPLRFIPGRENDFRRVVAAGVNGETFWSASFNRYIIEQYDMTGRLLRVFKPAAPWFKPWLSHAPEQTSPPPPRIAAIRQAGDKLLVLIPVADRNWKKTGFKRVAGPQSAPLLWELPDQNKLYDTLIDVIDIRSGELLGRIQHDVFFFGFASDSLLFSPRQSRDGDVVVDLWRVNITSVGGRK